MIDLVLKPDVDVTQYVLFTFIGTLVILFLILYGSSFVSKLLYKYVKNYLFKKCKYLLNKEGILIKYLDHLDNPYDLGAYAYCYDTWNDSYKPIHIEVLKELKFINNFDREIVILHELGHHFSLKFYANKSEHSANKWAKDYIKTFPIIIQICVKKTVSRLLHS